MSHCQNGAPPMYLAWTNVTVTLDQKAFSRGIPISIGTPSQLVSLRPSTADDDLYPVNKAACAPSFNDTCIGIYGGVFDPSTSKSFHQVQGEGQWNGTTGSNTGSLSDIYFNDDLSFGNATAYGFPALLDQPGYGGQGILPLGFGSDFLKYAFAIGAVPSKAFSIWTGSRSIDNPVDGSVVIGGYDTTRYHGELTTFTSNAQCATCVVVTGLTYDTPDGSVSLFSNASETLQVSLQPAEKVLNLTPDIHANFAKATGGVWDDTFENLIYPANHPPMGNLTVTLSNNNYKTTIPAADLFVLPRRYNTEGQYAITNNTILLAEVAPLNNTGFVYDWGIPYLTMNYLLVDYAREQFQLAEAIRTDFQSQGGGPLLAAICDPATPTSTTSATSSTAAPSKTSTPTPAPVHQGGSNNTGAIVGGVVGGVLGLILIVGILGFLFYRNRRRARSTIEAPGPAAQPPRDEMAYHGTPAERVSQYTATSPTVLSANELSSEKAGGVASVNDWLSSHGSETVASKNMDRPFEMPAGRYEDDN